MVEGTSIMLGVHNSCCLASCSLSCLFFSTCSGLGSGSTTLKETVLPEKRVDTVGSGSQPELQWDNCRTVRDSTPQAR